MKADHAGLGHLLERAVAPRRAAAPQAPTQDGRCLGAAAQLAAVQRTLRHGPLVQLQAGGAAAEARPAAANRTGLPDRLKAGVEALSGVSLDGVKVHYNSSKPKQLNALAYAQGSDIHLGPGQEKHLPHETWHIVQQAQGRVMPTMQMKNGVPVNDDAGLEREADIMGARASGSISRAADGEHALGALATGGIGSLVQLVRAPIAPPALPATLAILEQTIGDYDAQIGELDQTAAEIVNGFLTPEDLQKIQRWRGQYDLRIAALRNLNPGNMTISKDQISLRDTAVRGAFYDVLITLGNIRKMLNDSHREYTEWKRKRDAPLVEEPKYKDTFDHTQKAKTQQEGEIKKQSESAKQRKPGLEGKWKGYVNKLKYNGQTVFHQHVPADAGTIAKSLTSQNILDAVYHTDKAFWLADPTQFQLASAKGKVRMEYTFNAKAARSLMEDFLINGSGDFAEDNEQLFSGETGHPYYTIWKTNEIGAYGIGAQRLAELAGGVTKIEAVDAEGKKIKP